MTKHRMILERVKAAARLLKEAAGLMREHGQTHALRGRPSVADYWRHAAGCFELRERSVKDDLDCMADMPDGE